MVSGCTNSTTNPEKTVKDFFAAFKEGDFEKANGFLSEDNQIDNMEESISPGGLETSYDEMSKELISSINVSVKSHEINGDNATVNTIVSWPDMEILRGKLLEGAMSVAIQAALSNASQEEIDLLLKPVFLDALSDTPNVETPHEIQLSLVNNNWVISTYPFPNPKNVFNLPDHGEGAEGQSGNGQ